MTHRILVLYGSYRSDRMGIRLAQFVVEGFSARGDNVELIDAKEVGLPMLDRMYKEHPKGQAPAALEKLAGQIREADGFVFITGEYNWGVQPGLKNLTDQHFIGNGHGGDLVHRCGRADRAIALGGGHADRGRRQGAGAGVSAVRR